MSDFELAIKTAAEKAVLKMVLDGSWIAPDYSNRFKMPPEMLADVWRMIDQDRLKAALVVRIESELADRIVNMMAAEIATDVKQILSVQERRESIRHFARQHMDAIMGSTK